MVVQTGLYGNIGIGIPSFLGREVMGHGFFNAQHTNCAQFEINWHRCLEAFGHYLGTRYCDLEWRDFNECIYHTKKKKRTMALSTERYQQFFKGERDRVHTIRWPKPNEIRPDWYDKGRMF